VVGAAILGPVIVLFDLDGTVWDSAPGIVASLVHTFESFGMAVPPDDVLAANLGPPLQVMLAELGIPAALVDEGVVHYRDRYREKGVFEASVYPGIETVLDELLSDGHRLATATSKGEGPTHLMLDHFGLRERFSVVGAATMDDTAITKSQVLARTLERLGEPEPGECIMVGDRHYDVAGAAEHGLDCIGVAWGYGSRRELEEAGALAVVDDPSDLLGVLSQRWSQ
jgi:phosphoglycolate phosphatase